MLYPLDAIEMEGFTSNLDRINLLAEQSDGFIWRLKNDADDALNAVQYFGEDTIVNMSTWRSINHLHHYVYKTAHTEVLRRKKEWFSELKTYHVLWWHNAEAHPSVQLASEKLAHLDRHGPTEMAFTFRKAWPMPTA